MQTKLSTKYALSLNMSKLWMQ